ncbi:S-protein homolog 29-like [Henckelia pumila]|uniref:S-protein homolog 29-like n=1 Tax=Henckelia pumila TaxID=405737 RepID=UPI003C6E87D3
MGNLFFFLVIYLMSVYVVQSVIIRGPVCANYYHYQVFVYHSISISQDAVPLRTYCASKDKHIGYKILNYGESLDWDFCNFPEKPRTFTCHLMWGSKLAIFESFNATLAPACGGRDNDCSWFARADGVYFDQQKMIDWGNVRT